MKFLIASVGNMMNSYVAKRFEHAAWYLIVNDETKAFDAAQNVMPHDHHSILVRASSEDVDVVVGGKFSTSSLKLIQARDLSVAHLHGISVTHAIERIKSGEVRTESEFGLERDTERLIGIMPRIMTMKGKRRAVGTGFASDSLRGQHHLQQYGGRGH